MRWFGFGKPEKSQGTEVLELTEGLKVIEHFELLAQVDAAQAMAFFEQRLEGVFTKWIGTGGPLYDDFVATLANVKRTLQQNSVRDIPPSSESESEPPEPVTIRRLPKHVVTEWGLSSLSEEDQASMIDRIGKLIYEGLLVGSLGYLSEADTSDLDLLLDQDETGPDDVLGFLQSKIPSFQELRTQEISKLRKQLQLPPESSAKAELYSCFISYSVKDQEFANRLFNDLQASGVNCWFAPHDIVGGRKLIEQITEAIHLHDKVLLILSEASMNSEWVKTEIAKARKREKQEHEAGRAGQILCLVGGICG